LASVERTAKYNPYNLLTNLFFPIRKKVNQENFHILAGNINFN